MTVAVPVPRAELPGDLTIPHGAHGLVVFAHGGGSSRHSLRDRHIAETLAWGGLATLRFDLVTAEEAAQGAYDIGLCAGRVVAALDWLGQLEETRDLHVGLIGSGNGAAVALVAAAGRPTVVGAVVARGGRPDLAGDALRGVVAPSLFIIGAKDVAVIGLNQRALVTMRCDKRLEVIHGASSYFQETGALERVAGIARDWFAHHLTPTQHQLAHGEPMSP